MGILPYNDILQIHGEAIKAGLGAQRDLLLGGVVIEYRALLPNVTNATGQLLSDLMTMNDHGTIANMTVPLEIWLRTASHLTSMFPARQKLFRAMADKAADLVADAPENDAPDPPVLPEKIIHTNDLVPYGFLAGAIECGRAVARLMVPRHEGVTATMNSSNTQPVEFAGTGWLIGKKHVVTNYHVIQARLEGEGDASLEDLKLQALGTKVQFDFDDPATPGATFQTAQLCAWDRDLDYAVLELSADSNRTPLRLLKGEVRLPFDGRMPVNIIQHPSGASKQLGIRNNLVESVTKEAIFYFTDTESGSSGSPVCTDDWVVVALHRAASRERGRVEYQGKNTVWVNKGTRIDCIVQHLKSNHAALWNVIGPRT
jgi:hypothetical protein